MNHDRESSSQHPGLRLTLRRQRRQRGQTAVLLALMFVGLIAFIGFALDAGQVYLVLVQLRRAVDAASLAGALEARGAAADTEITDAATQMMQLHGFDVSAGLDVALCPDTVPYTPGVGYDTLHADYDATICTDPPRKLVRVTASTLVNFVFMSIVPGVPQETTLSASAVAEAASLEIVLLLDTSMSMSFDYPIGDPSRGTCTIDPLACNVTCNNTAPTAGQFLSGELPDWPGYNERSNCRPFEWVRYAAWSFIEDFTLQPFDRVSIVEFAGSPAQDYNNDGDVTAYQELDSAAALSKVNTQTALHDLYVSPNWGQHTNLALSHITAVTPDCLNTTTEYVSATGLTNLEMFLQKPGPCQATNIGGALRVAIDELQKARQGSLRFIILLSDGETNATDSPYYCPNVQDTLAANYDPHYSNRTCSDGDARVRHGIGTNNTEPPLSYVNDPFASPSAPITSDVPQYDADDYARFQADRVLEEGNVIMFTIGLGQAVVNNPNDGGACVVQDPSDANYDGDWDDSSAGKNQNAGNADCQPNGEQLLRYIADIGDGSTNEVCGLVTSGIESGLYKTAIGASCGNYFFTNDASILPDIFDLIAERIFTRLTQ